MKSITNKSLIAILFIISLTACGMVGDKDTNLSLIYTSAAIISLLLLIGCCCLVRQMKTWFIMLFSSVLVVNVGYTILSVSTCLQMALWANRIAYLGSVFLPFAMLMIILNVTKTNYPKWLYVVLGGFAIIVFLIAASPGILPIYYKDVSFAVVNGVSTLVKVYGPLHPIYLFYLLGYFAVMVAFIIRTQVKKTISTTVHAVILAIAVFVNIGVWFIEQLTSIDFEMLSISYIISELFLLGIHLVMNEYQKMSSIVEQMESVQTDYSSANVMLNSPLNTDIISSKQIEVFMSGLERLTPTERAVFDAHISRVTTKEIMANLNIKESTLKFHNRNLYSKLGVSSRKELLEMHKHIMSMKTKFDIE